MQSKVQRCWVTSWGPVWLRVAGVLLVTIAAHWAGSASSQETGLDLSTFNRSVRPQDDLFEFVNGTWLRTTPIPDDKSDYGSFGILADLSQERVKKLIEKLAAEQHSAGSDEQKIGDFYRAFMNVDRIEAEGIGPLQSQLEKIDQLDSKERIWEHFGYNRQIGVRTPVQFFVSQDARNSEQYLSQITQGGLSLPDRDYYLKQDEVSEQARDALKNYISTLLELAGQSNARAAAEEVFELERKLAEISWSRVELRDAEKRYNKFTLEQWYADLDSVDWEGFFYAVGIEPPDELNVNTPSFFQKLLPIFEQTELDVWKNYLRFQLLNSFSPYLSEPFVKANFELYGQTLAGIPELEPRWKRCVNAISGRGAGDFGALGEAVGRLYVAEYFKPEAKAKMNELVDNLLVSFGTSIQELSWMSDQTKARATEKLFKITTKIGYPNQWRDYSRLRVEADDLIGNVMRSNVVEHFRNADKLGQPIDREEWGMTPQTVNAYYNPLKNEIVFPAAILQPPFFSMDAPDALNYGGIGAVIGHEISHAFDDQGSRYDGDGNLNNWWTEQDSAAFKQLADQLVAQYEAYEPLPGKPVNGRLTLGENIADLSGLTIAHKALRLSLGDREPEKIAGWNADQLFFVGWSRVWQRKYRDAEMVKRLLTDPHSPSKYRANGPVTNIDAFQQAFDLKPGDILYKSPEERIKIW
jgi:putative endopeptidase